MARALKLPDRLAARQGVLARLLLAGVQVEGPGLGVERVADDEGPDAAADGLRPLERAVIGRERNHAALCVVAAQKLAPPVAVEMRAGEHKHAVGGHRDQRPAAGPDAGAVGQVHGPLPQDAARRGVEGDRDLHVRPRKLLQRRRLINALLRPQLRDALLEGLFALRRVGALVGEENAPVMQGDAVVPDLRAVMLPGKLAGARVVGEDLAGRPASGPCAAVQRAALNRHPRPAAALPLGVGRRLKCRHRLAGEGIEKQAAGACRDEDAPLVGGDVGGVVRGADAVGAVNLALPVDDAVVGVKADDAVDALQVDAPVDYQGRDVAGMAAGDLVRPRLAVPQQAQRPLEGGVR